MGGVKMCKKSHWDELPPWLDTIGLKEVIKAKGNSSWGFVEQ
jgi:hypothetical protein